MGLLAWRWTCHIRIHDMKYLIPRFFSGWSLGFAAFVWGALCQTYMFGGSDRRWQGSESLLPWFGHLAASDLEAPTRLLCGDQHAELRKYQTCCYVEWMFRRQKLPEELWYLAGALILSHCQRKRQLKREGTWTQFRWSTPRLLPIQVPCEHRADLICFNDKRLMHRRCDEFQDLWRCLRRAEKSVAAMGHVCSSLVLILHFQDPEVSLIFTDFSRTYHDIDIRDDTGID